MNPFHLTHGQVVDGSISAVNQKVRQILLVIGLPSLTLIVLFFFISLRHGMSVTSVALKARSSAVVHCLNEMCSTGICLWPQDALTLPNHRSSVNYFNWLITDVLASGGEYDNNCLRHLREELVSQLYGRPFFSEKNMPWIIVKNLPEDAPDNFIVMASANVSPASLRTRLAEEDMDKRIEIAKNPQMRVLRKRIYLIRRNGQVIELWKGRSPQENFTYREVYDNSFFDLTTNLVNGLPVKYLTPTGEVTPTNK